MSLCLTGILARQDLTALRWEDLYDETVAQGKFLWSVTFFITSGRKPAG
jgi:hypothetical protein